ncbi:MAG: AzlD domain-containing protein [Nocardioides sp.]
MWPAIVLVGLGSYVLRVVPLLLGGRLRLSQRADAALRHASVSAMTALMVLSAQRMTTSVTDLHTLAVVVALAVSGGVALRGRSMFLVVVCGAATYGLTLGVLHVLLG